ncbi:MAG: hypothetical protein PUC05_04935, partial [Firmicutes bacterium]|nr:hypothetical protein [Bacillota bacterium]
ITKEQTIQLQKTKTALGQSQKRQPKAAVESHKCTLAQFEDASLPGYSHVFGNVQTGKRCKIAVSAPPVLAALSGAAK